MKMLSLSMIALVGLWISQAVPGKVQRPLEINNSNYLESELAQPKLTRPGHLSAEVLIGRTLTIRTSLSSKIVSSSSSRMGTKKKTAPANE
jgi:hypothetical protein